MSPSFQGRSNPDSDGNEGCFSKGIGQVTNLFAKQNIHERPVERLNKLSPEERVNALNDLHGVSLLPDECPEILALKLAQMDAEISDLVTPARSQTRSYIEARRQNSEYVDSQRLKFLRADNLVPKEAAGRMIKHFELKEKLFGRDKLGKDLDFLDLSERDRELFRLGYVQLSIKRDRIGRGIIILIGKEGNEYPLEFLVRFQFFIISIMSNDDEIIRKGLVSLYYGIGQRKIAKVEESLLLIRSLNAQIGRINAIHVCYDSDLFDAIFKLTNWSMDTRYLCRLQSHYGTQMECKYSLTTFGIPQDVVTVDDSGNIDNSHHLKWLEKLERDALAKRTEENGNCVPSTIVSSSANTSISTIPLPWGETPLTPGTHDVILGRGRRGLNSAGNHKLKSLVQEYRTVYEKSGRYEKCAIVDVIYKTLTNSGSRFMTYIKKNPDGTGGGWIEVEEDAACSKISHDFRNLRLKEKSSRAA